MAPSNTIDASTDSPQTQTSRQATPVGSVQPATRHLRRRLVSAVAAPVALALALVAAACVPPPPGEPTEGAQITVSPVPEAVTPGTTVTVTGTGFNAAGNLGTRPPFLNQPAGVYVVFARVTDPWKPSEGGPSGNRQVIAQAWALPQAQYNALGGAATPGLALMSAEGEFSVELTLDEAPGAGRYAIITYPGGGAINAGEELEVPVSFASP